VAAEDAVVEDAVVRAPAVAVEHPVDRAARVVRARAALAAVDAVSAKGATVKADAAMAAVSSWKT
jgi:hypothetical protein